MAFKHGIYINERPTSLVPMKTAESAITIAFVVAPVNTIDETYKSTNVPKVCFNLKEFVESFGYSNDNENWYKYTSNEVCDTFFKEYNTAPIIVVNVLDPNKHIKNNSEKYILDIQNSKILTNKDILLDTINLEVEVSEEKPIDNKPPTGENSKPNSRKNIINLILQEVIKNDNMYVKIIYNGTEEQGYNRFKIEIIPILSECGIKVEF